MNATYTEQVAAHEHQIARQIANLERERDQARNELADAKRKIESLQQFSRAQKVMIERLIN